MVETSGPLILIVDDYPDALEIYETYLTYRGYRVVTASSGAEGIEIARAQRPAIIFMDLRMFEMSGTTAMQRLREDPAFANVPIVALTAHAMRSEKLQAIADGFDELIPKPCVPDELVAAINRLLGSPHPPETPDNPSLPSV